MNSIGSQPSSFSSSHCNSRTNRTPAARYFACCIRLGHRQRRGVKHSKTTVARKPASEFAHNFRSVLRLLVDRYIFSFFSFITNLFLPYFTALPYPASWDLALDVFHLVRVLCICFRVALFRKKEKIVCVITSFVLQDLISAIIYFICFDYFITDAHLLCCVY